MISIGITTHGIILITARIIGLQDGDGMTHGTQDGTDRGMEDGIIVGMSDGTTPGMMAGIRITTALYGL